MKITVAFEFSTYGRVWSEEELEEFVGTMLKDVDLDDLLPLSVEYRVDE